MSKLRYLGLCAASMLALAVANAKPSIAAPTDYTITKTVPLGGGIRWDYLHFDPASDRLFISHGTELTVLNGQTGAVIGHVRGLHGSHGIAIDHATGLGYADSSGTQTTTIFNLKTLRTVKTIPALKDADGMAIDPASNQVFVAAGDSNAVMPIDLKTNESGKPIALGGAPEFLVADGAGSLYINLNDKNEIAKIDTRTDTVVAHWPLTSCDRPTGLAMDTANAPSVRLLPEFHDGGGECGYRRPGRDIADRQGHGCRRLRSDHEAGFQFEPGWHAFHHSRRRCGSFHCAAAGKD